MASRFSRTLLAQAARPAMRTSMRNAGRRMMATESHAAKDSDLPWIIGAAVVFGPMAFYLLTPPAKKQIHKAEEKKGVRSEPVKSAPVPLTPVPTKDDEGTEVPAAEVAASVQTAINEDSPKDAHAAEEGKGTTPAEAAESASAEEAATSAPEAESPKAAEGAQTEEHPSDLGEARESSQAGKSPKEAKKESEQA